MPKIKKHISILLLFVFSWLIFPSNLLHERFANHEDTDDSYCVKYHKNDSGHIEAAHIHCKIFNANSLSFCGTKINCHLNFISVLIDDFNSELKLSSYQFTFLAISARGPPLV